MIHKYLAVFSETEQLIIGRVTEENLQYLRSQIFTKKKHMESATDWRLTTPIYITPQGKIIGCGSHSPIPHRHRHVPQPLIPAPPTEAPTEASTEIQLVWDKNELLGFKEKAPLTLLQKAVITATINCYKRLK